MTVKVDRELQHAFVRTDKHERARKMVRTESYHVRALQRWAHRKLKRLSQEGGIAFSWPPAVDYEREIAMRNTIWYVWTDYALLEGRPGEMFAAPHDKRWLPL